MELVVLEKGCKCKDTTVKSYVDVWWPLQMETLSAGIRKDIIHYSGNSATTHNNDFSVSIYDNGLRIHSVGYAHCHEGDTYNEDFGKTLAESRAHKRLYKFVRNISTKISTHYNNLVTEIESIAGTYTDAYDTEVEYETSLLSEVK